MMPAVRSLLPSPWLRGLRAGTIAAALALAAGCASTPGKVPTGTAEPDKFLFERGTAALADEKWMTAREFLQTLIDTYPQSPFRADAKLALGDTYIGENSPAAQVMALNEFREFLSFFPTHARADYAQYKLALSHFNQMAKAGRDQTETKEAIKEFEVFFERFPNSALAAEAKEKYRDARDRLGESEFLVGLTYYRLKWYPGAIARLQELLKTDPQFTLRDGAYYYLAESLVKVNRPAEALPLLEKLVTEFEKSEFLEKAQVRMAELKGAAATAAQPKS